MKYPTFAKLFNELRLKAGFESLSEFGKALATEGYIYEDSTFSRWKTGSRAPQNPRIIAAIVKVFTEHNAIQSKEEIIHLYESVQLSPPFYLINPASVPEQQSTEELAEYVMKQILGEAFIKLHATAVKPYREIAQRDFKKFVSMIKHIQQNPQNYVHIRQKYPYVINEKRVLVWPFLKKAAIVSKYDVHVMGLVTTSGISYRHDKYAYCLANR